MVASRPISPGILKACRDLNAARRALGVKPLDVATMARWPARTLLRFLVDYSARVLEAERRGSGQVFVERVRCERCGDLRPLGDGRCGCGAAAGPVVTGFVLAAAVARRPVARALQERIGA